jgi:hypothetical protein
MRFPFRLTSATGICAVAIIAIAIVPTSMHGQTTVSVPDTACYVPSSGSAYVIKRPTAPPNCVSKNHYKFPWGGTAGPPGPQGETGPAGPTGATGPAGPAASVVLSGGTLGEATGETFVGPFMHPGSGGPKTEVEVPLPSGGTLSNVRFYVGQASFTTISGFMVLNSGVITGLGCNILPGSTYCSADGSVTFAPGDRIIISVFTNTPARVGWVATLQ